MRKERRLRLNGMEGKESEMERGRARVRTLKMD